MFFLKENKVVIDLLISENNSHAYDLFAPVEAIKVVPEWFKTCPQHKFDWGSFEPVLTAKGCLGIREHLTNGFVIPLWADINVKTNTDEINWFVSGYESSWIKPHDTETQTPNFLNDHFVLKLINPWVILNNASHNIKFMYVGAQYHMPVKPTYTVLQGIYNPLASINLHKFIAFPKAYGTHSIKAGSILGQWVPMSDKKIVVKNHLVTEQEISKHVSGTKLFSFSFSGVKRMQILKNKMKLKDNK